MKEAPKEHKYTEGNQDKHPQKEPETKRRSNAHKMVRSLGEYQADAEEIHGFDMISTLHVLHFLKELRQSIYRREIPVLEEVRQYNKSLEVSTHFIPSSPLLLKSILKEKCLPFPTIN